MYKYMCVSAQLFSHLYWSVHTAEGGEVAKELLETPVLETTRQVVASLAT